MIAQLRTLEASKAPRAWLEVAALYARVTPAVRVAFIKALRRLEAPRRAAALLASGGSEAETIAALNVLRVMKPREAPVQVAFDHPSAAVRQQAALAAVAVPMHPQLREGLLALLDDSDRLVRDFAVSALRRVEDSVVTERLAHRLAVEMDPLVQGDLQNALTARGVPDAVGIPRSLAK